MNKFVFVFLVLFLFMNPLPACLWDRDTFAMEKEAFPDIWDLITGNFIRHSNEYYQWRIDKIQPIIDEGVQDISLYDDLAVAYSKLERNKEAIKLMKKKNRIKPDQYETYANMGTFYIHDGKLKKGLKFIEKAIKINPDAHFGREVYQKYLVEYLLMNNNEKEKSNFYTFLTEKYKQEHPSYERHNLPDKELKKIHQRNSRNDAIWKP